MATIRLSKRYCDEATHTGGQDIRWDAQVSGLGLRIYPSGKKSWVIRYRGKGGRQRLHVLAPYSHLTLDQARKEGAARLGDVAREKDPAEERRQARKGETVEALVKAYVKEWARPRKRSWAEDERQLNADVVPAWGTRLSKDITRADVRVLLAQVEQRGPIAANRLLSVIRRMFRWACEQDLLTASPCVGVRPPGRETEKERVLSIDEVQTVWSVLPQDTDSARALRLVLVTAQRPGEVAGLRWEEIAGDWWTLPAARAKNRLTHRVPLSGLALELLGKPKKRGRVFDLKHRNSLNQLVYRHRDNLPRFTPHDLRRTAASHMTADGVPRLVVGRILNHLEPGVTRIYDRHSYDAEKRAVLEAWGERLRHLVAPDRQGESGETDEE